MLPVSDAVHRNTRLALLCRSGSLRVVSLPLLLSELQCKASAWHTLTLSALAHQINALPWRVTAVPYPCQSVRSFTITDQSILCFTPACPNTSTQRNCISNHNSTWPRRFTSSLFHRLSYHALLGCSFADPLHIKATQHHCQSELRYSFTKQVYA